MKQLALKKYNYEIPRHKKKRNRSLTRRYGDSRYYLHNIISFNDSFIKMKNIYKALAEFQQEVPVILKDTSGYGY